MQAMKALIRLCECTLIVLHLLRKHLVFHLVQQAESMLIEQYTTISYLSVQQSKLLPLWCCGWADALLPKAEGTSVSGHPQHLRGDSFDCCTERYEIVVLLRAVAAYLKVVRRRKPSSAEGTRRGRAWEGELFPLFLGGFGGLPLELFWILSASMCVFNVFFMHLGTDFSQDFLLENIWNQMIFFYFFLQHVSLTLFHLCSCRLWQSNLSTDP